MLPIQNSLLEKHAFNFKLYDAGSRPHVFNWLGFLYQRLGGVVGTLELASSSGFIGLVSADEPSRHSSPEPEFWDELKIENAPAHDFGHLMYQFMVSNAGLNGFMEASYSEQAFGFDMVRSIFHVKDGQNGALRGRVVDELDPRKLVLEERVIRNRHGLHDGPSPSPILLSVAECGDVLFITEDNVVGTNSVEVSAKNIRFMTTTDVVLQAPMTNIGALKGILQHTHCRVAASSENGYSVTDLFPLKFV